MKTRVLVAAAALWLSGCFNFDQALGDCRTADGWVCGPGVDDAGGGDAGDGEDAGTGDAGPADAGGLDGGSDGGAMQPDASVALPTTDGLFCQQGWCWEHPRPARFDLEAVSGKSRDDYWVGGSGGVLAHWDGAKWSGGQALEREVRVRSICDHGDDLYFGMGWFASGTSSKQLFRYRDGGWLDLSASVGDVKQVACGDTRLLVAHRDGVSAMDWTTGLFSNLHTDPDEVCDAVLELGNGDCLFTCHHDGSATMPRLLRCDDSVELAPTSPPNGLTFHTLLAHPTRGPLLVTELDVLQRDAGWQSVWNATAATALFAGANTATGSVIVGNYGTIVDLGATDAGQTQFQALWNGTLANVWAPPGGQPIAVGEHGCIIERSPQGWTRRNDCSRLITDVSFGPEVLALADDQMPDMTPAVLARADGGWVVRQALAAPRLGLRQLRDGGLVLLTESALEVGPAELDLGVTDARAFELVNDTRAVVTTLDGGVVELRLPNGERTDTTVSGAAGRPLLDERGMVWLRSSTGPVWRSAGAGAWTTEAVGDGGVLTDLAVGNGRVWALQDATVFWRSTTTSGWTTLSAPRPFTRLVPLKDDRVLLLNGDADALVLDGVGRRYPVTASPTRLTGPLFSINGEAWGVGDTGGLVRFTQP